MNYQSHIARASAWLVAGVLSTSVAYGDPATVDNATKAQLKTATGYYEHGVSAMDAEKYDEALKQFQLSFDTVSSPNSRLMIGRVLAKMGKNAEAYQELERTLSQAAVLAEGQKKYKKTVETAQKELDDVKKQLAFVRVKPGVKVQIQGTPVELTSWQTLLPVIPGTVSVGLTFGNGRTLTKSLTLKAGDVAEVTLDELPSTQGKTVNATVPGKAQAPVDNVSPESTLNRRTVGYIVGGVGLVGLGAFVGFGLIGASSYGDSKADCAPLGCPESSIDNERSKALLQCVGYTGLGIGILGVGVGTWLILTGGKTTPSTALHLAPNSVQVTHRF